MTYDDRGCSACSGSGECPDCDEGEEDCDSCFGDGLCYFCDGSGVDPNEEAVEDDGGFAEEDE